MRDSPRVPRERKLNPWPLVGLGLSLMLWGLILWWWLA